MCLYILVLLCFVCLSAIIIQNRVSEGQNREVNSPLESYAQHSLNATAITQQFIVTSYL